MEELMCSGLLLESEVQKFCANNNLDEGEMWQVINRIHTNQYGRNIMWEKQQEEKEKGISDIPMSEQFAKNVLVHRVIEILKGLQECCNNGWDFE